MAKTIYHHLGQQIWAEEHQKPHPDYREASSPATAAAENHQTNPSTAMAQDTALETDH
jgi:hypothetical protein